MITPNLFGFQAAQNSFGTGRPYVNGAREQENNFLLDGMDNNQPDNNDVGYVPAPEAVQEFNLITGSAPADFGNYLGGVVNVTVKSGTNDFHGSLYEYLRRGGLNANSWQNNHACAQNADRHHHSVAGETRPASRSLPGRRCTMTILASPLVDRSSRTSCSFSPISRSHSFLNPQQSPN